MDRFRRDTVRPSRGGSGSSCCMLLPQGHEARRKIEIAGCILNNTAITALSITAGAKLVTVLRFRLEAWASWLCGCWLRDVFCSYSAQAPHRFEKAGTAQPIPTPRTRGRAALSPESYTPGFGFEPRGVCQCLVWVRCVCVQRSESSEAKLLFRTKRVIS